MIFIKKNDEAVSPVIGVILMVAITVILAAVIASFVFGLTGNMSKSKIVAVTITKQGLSGIELTDQGGQDQGSLLAINATTSPNPATSCATSGTKITGVDAPVCSIANPAIGSTITLTGTYSGRTEVTVAGTFSDETTQVLLDTFL